MYIAKNDVMAQLLSRCAIYFVAINIHLFSILCVSNNACFNFSNALSNKSQFFTKNPLRQIELFALNPLKENLDDEADRER